MILIHSTAWRQLAAYALLVGMTLVLAACGESPTETEAIRTQPEGEPAPELPESGEKTDDEGGSLTLATVPLPFSGSVNSSASAFRITQNGSGAALHGRNQGSGIAVHAEITGAGNFSPALRATTPAGGGNAIYAEKSGSGSAHTLVARNIGDGPVALLEQANSSAFRDAVSILHRGGGNSVLVTQAGTGRAGIFQVTNSTSAADALLVTTRGTGQAGLFQINNSASPATALRIVSNNRPPSGALLVDHSGAFGRAATIQSMNSNNSEAGVLIFTRGVGTTLKVDHVNSSGDIAEFFAGHAFPEIRFDINGRGFFNGGTQTGGADVAEALAVEGSPARYRPGDVLVISARQPRRVTTTSERYSTRVVGVYATKPGVLLTERDIHRNIADLIPVGVVGVVPTRVSAENGPIRLGDLLVTSSRPGHAMRASPIVVQGVTLYPTGAILGRAMEEFRGPGTGLIRVLVSLK